MTDKMREEFERSPKFRGMDFRRAPEAPEYYLSPYANGAWDGWQASREALVIELPQIVGYEAGYDSIRENEYASQSSELFDADEVFALCRSIEVREAIEAAGVKVKS
ncbi:hypothetical protein [Pseudomonas veronii]